MLEKLSPHLYALTLVCSLNLIVEIAPYSDILCLNGWTYNSLPLILVLRSFWDFYLSLYKHWQAFWSVVIFYPSVLQKLVMWKQIFLNKTWNHFRKISLLAIPIVIDPYLMFCLPCMRFWQSQFHLQPFHNSFVLNAPLTKYHNLPQEGIMWPTFVFIILSSSLDTSMSLLVLLDILVDYSEMSLSNVVEDVTYGSLVQFYCLTIKYLMQSNGLEHQITFLNTFFPIKYLFIFVSVVYLNLFLNNVSVPSANSFGWVLFLV